MKDLKPKLYFIWIFLIFSVSFPVKGQEEVTLTVPVLFENKIPEDFSLVNDAVNKIVEDRIGVKVNLVSLIYTNSSYHLNKRNYYELTFLEKQGTIFDVAPNSLPDISFIPLNALLKEEGQDILRLIEEDRLSFEEKEGVIYTIPSVSDYVSSFAITMRKDIIEKYNIKLPEKYTFEELDELFDIIHQHEPDLYLICGYRANAAMIGRLKNAVLDGNSFCTLLSPETYQFTNYYATQEYRTIVSLFYRWRQCGYIPPFSVIQNIPSSQLVRAGILFSYFSAYKPSIEYEESISCGTEMVTIPLMDSVVTSYSLGASVHWGINQESEHPEEAMKFLNLLYSDKELINLLIYGIEGIHYELLADGTVSYPDGITQDTVKYSNTQPWLLPNQLLTHVWEGTDPMIWEETKAYNSSAPWRDTVFFLFDSKDCQRELDAINDVLKKYTSGLESGQLNPDIYLNTMLEEMEQAGSEHVLKEIEKQYKIWKEQ